MFPGMKAKLADFGLARTKAHTTVTWGGQGITGSLPYIAPEVLVGVPVKSKMKAQPFSDVWSLSTSLVEWFTGQFPWQLCKDDEDLHKQIKTKQKVQQQPEGLSQVPDKVRQVLSEGLSYNYRSRPTAKTIKERMGV
jgi:serine/threonine protein kinase